jgi:uncharacterized protein (DUF58 family)
VAFTSALRGRTGGAGRADARGHGSELLAALERRSGLTSVGLLTLAIAIAGWFAGREIKSRGVFLLVYGVVMVLVIAWLLGRRKLAVDAGRSDLPTRVRAGQQVTVEMRLTARRRVSTLILEESMDEALGTPVRVPVPLLPSGETVTHEYTFTPKLRGIYNVGPLMAEWNDPFGLTRSRVMLCEPTEIIVHPAIEQVSDRVTSREWEDPPVRPPIFKPWPSGFEFYGLRDYVPGDDPRRIVWRAVAQYDEYLVRESEQGITDRVNIFLDTDVEYHSPGEPSETFETGVRAAASLGIKHLKDGFAVSVEVNGDRMTKNMRGLGKQIALLDAFAAVNREKAPLTLALDRLLVDPARNSHNVIVTPYLSQAVASRLRLLRDRGTAVMLVLLLWDDTDPATLHRAGSLGVNVVEITASSSLGRVFQNVVGARR